MPRDLLPLVRTAVADTYAVEREIGRGGAARVFLATSKDGTPLALKVLLPELQLSSTADRFLREIRLISQLRHPQIAPIVDSGTSNGLVYFVMPLIPGPTLREALKRTGMLSIEDTQRVASDLLGALGHAHDCQIVHRDVKPENIIISGDGAVLVDFGIARAIESAANDRVTATGMSVGTMGYMSPEQAIASESLDHRSDLYSVGCVLWECLTGATPFPNRNPSVALRLQLAGELPDLQIRRPETPDPLSAAIQRVLRPEPADRWPNARAMQQALGLP